MYGGAGLATWLFPYAGPGGTAWLRTLVGAVALVAWRRPWRERWPRRRLALAVVFGAALAVMNTAFYVAIDHLPLGAAVAVEFTGPVAVAAATGRGWRERLAIVPAALGVLLLADVAVDRLDHHDAVVGLTAVGVAATAWAAYILLGRRVAVGGPDAASGVTTLAVAMSCGALLSAPPFAADAVRGLAAAPQPGVAALAAVGVGVLSSVVPYALDQVVLRRVGTATYSVLLALLPATAALVGVVVLRQSPRLVEVVGLACVTVAIVLAGRPRG